jgi:hypothetical protein
MRKPGDVLPWNMSWKKAALNVPAGRVRSVKITRSPFTGVNVSIVCSWGKGLAIPTTHMTILQQSNLMKEDFQCVSDCETSGIWISP